MTVNFFDVLIIDPDTFAFLLTMFPNLGKAILAGCLRGGSGHGLDLAARPVAREAMARGRYLGTACLGVLGLAVGGATRTNPGTSFAPAIMYRNLRARVWRPFRIYGITAGLRRKRPLPDASQQRQRVNATRRTARRISFLCTTNRASISAPLTGLKVPPGYGEHFHSFDGQERQFLVESNGGSSWFAEYNVLTGLSSRSFGRLCVFSDARRRRPRQPRPAARAAALRLPHVFALSRRMARS